MIDSVVINSLSSPQIREYRNVNKAITYGGDVSAGTELDRFKAKVGYAYTGAKFFHAPIARWENLALRVNHRVTAYTSYRIPVIETEIALNMQWNSLQLLTAKTAYYTPDYLMVGLDISKKFLDEKLEIYTALDNILNNIHFIKGTNGETQKQYYGLTGIEAMSNTRVPMERQKKIPLNPNAPQIAFDPSIQDVTIAVPSAASTVDWGGLDLYTGKFDYLVGPGGKLARGHRSCGKDSGGNVIIPKVGINKGAAGSHTVTLKALRFAYTQQMTAEAFDIPNVQVFKDGNNYYLKLAESSVTAKKADGSNLILNNVTVDGKLESGKLTLRVSFKPGKMPFSIIEVFKSN